MAQQADAILPAESGDLEIDLGLSGTLSQLQKFAERKPRPEPVKVLAGAIAELNVDAVHALAYYYSMPFKNHDWQSSDCNKSPSDGCPATWVEGPSVKSARALMRLYHNCGVFGSVIFENNEKAKVRALFIDFENNAIYADEKTVSKYDRKRNGDTYHVGDHRSQLKIAATLSKCERNVIIEGLPEWLVQQFFAEAIKLSGETGDRKTVGELLTAFNRQGIDAGMLRGALGHEVEAGKMSPEELARLRGLYGGLSRKDITPSEVISALGGKAVDARPEEKSGRGAAAAAGGATVGERGAGPGPGKQSDVPTQPNNDGDGESGEDTAPPTGTGGVSSDEPPAQERKEEPAAADEGGWL